MAAGWQIGSVSSAVSILTAVIDAPRILVMLHLNKLAKLRRCVLRIKLGTLTRNTFWKIHFVNQNLKPVGHSVPKTNDVP